MSLRWKFVLIPVLGFILMAIVLFVFIHFTNRLHLSNSAKVDRKLDAIQVFNQIGNDLAINHVRIYELLRTAVNYSDEGEFYDAGKPFLLEMHRIEDALGSTIDVGSLSDEEAALLKKIQKKITDYRNNTVNAILIATVEQDLANRFLADSTAQYNQLSADILALNHINQNLLSNSFRTFNADLGRQIGVFSVIFLGLVGVMIILSYALSKVLLKDISSSIATLAELTGKKNTDILQISPSGNEMAILARAIVDAIDTHRSLESMSAELQEKESRLRAIIDNISEAVITIDVHGIVESYNLAAERIFAYQPAEVIGQNVSILMPEPDHSRHDQYLRNYLDTRIRNVIGNSREVLGRRKDGMLIDIEFTVTELVQGGKRSFTALLKDVTAIKAANAEIDRYRIHLEALVRERTMALEIANKELEAFSYSVSHDLRSPLRSIDGFSLAVIEDYSDQLDEVGMDYLTRVRHCAQDMAVLIDDMLQLSRMSRVKMHPEKVNLSKLATEIINNLLEGHEDRSITVEIANDMHCEGDRGLLKIMLENLLNNACKYTGRNPQAKIEFGKILVNGETVYYVKDNGAGFDMKYADKLFQEFTRLHDVNEFQGTGIGLATVQRIIRRHKGRIWAESEINKGATFYFVLDTETAVEKPIQKAAQLTGSYN